MIDADVHIPNPRLKDLLPLVPEHWVEHFNNTVDKGASQEYYPPRSPVAGRRGGLAELREAVPPVRKSASRGRTFSIRTTWSMRS